MTIDAFSIKFEDCKQIYPVKLIRPLVKLDSNIDKRVLGEVLDEISENNLRLKQYIADNKKRATVKDCKNHAAWHPCEYCYAKGIKIELNVNAPAKKKIEQQIRLVQVQIEECGNEENNPQNAVKLQHLVSLKEELKKSLNALNRKSHILWPYSTMVAQNRSRRTILEIIEKLESEENLSLDERKGILGRSLLLNVPEFNFVYDVPAEYMHCGCLGVIKRLVELTFAVGENRPRVTNRKLSSPTSFNELMMCTKVTKEFPRRGRKLDLAVYKAQEFRNLGLFFSLS